MKKVTTKGNVIVNDIKIGDIHYEYCYGVEIKVEVLTLPVRNDQGYWTWTSKVLSSGKTVNYGVTEGLEHYGPNIYNYQAYIGFNS